MPRVHNTCNVFNFPKFNDFRPFVLVGRTTSINPIYFLPTDKLYEELIRRSITQLAIVAVPRWPDPNQRSTLNLYDSLLILNIYFNFWYFDAGIVGTGASSISSTTSPKFKYYTIYIEYHYCTLSKTTVDLRLCLHFFLLEFLILSRTIWHVWDRTFMVDSCLPINIYFTVFSFSHDW